jgi:hypothetical protein
MHNTSRQAIDLVWQSATRTADSHPESTKADFVAL